ncbi:hypothetical protein J7L18_01590 [Candidatus Bathyarchaeota archaeon]|nr:hypothetical protein [Candidatus Bathyarchaeota archaeon]
MVTVDEEVTLSGRISPPASLPISLYVVRPDGTVEMKTLTSSPRRKLPLHINAPTRDGEVIIRTFDNRLRYKVRRSDVKKDSLTRKWME